MANWEAVTVLSRDSVAALTADGVKLVSPWHGALTAAGQAIAYHQLTKDGKYTGVILKGLINPVYGTFVVHTKRVTR